MSDSKSSTILRGILVVIAISLMPRGGEVVDASQYCCVSIGQGSRSCTESRLCNGPCYYAVLRWSFDPNVIINEPTKGNFVYFTGCWALDPSTNKGDQNMQNLLKFGGECEVDVFSNVNAASLPQMYQQLSKNNIFTTDRDSTTFFLEYAANLQDDYLHGIDYVQQNLLNNCNFTRISQNFVSDLGWADLALFDSYAKVTPNEAHISLCDTSPDFGNGKTPESPVNCAFLSCSTPRP